MRKPIAFFVAIGIAMLCQNISLYAQDNPNPLDKILKIPFRYISKVQKKYSNLDAKLTRQTEKYLSRLQKQEQKINKSISKRTSKVFSPLTNSQQFYDKLVSKVDSVKKDKLTPSGEYLPFIDSVQTSLSFLQKNNQFLSSSKDAQGQLKGALDEVKQFQARLQATEKIKEYIKQRKEIIKQQLQKYTNLPGSVSKAYSGYSKEFYYYSTQLQEVKALADDPDKLTKKALAILGKSKLFQTYAKQYSQLASLFSLPNDYGNAQSLGGMQTKTEVFGLIQSQLGSTSSGGTQMLSQSLQSAQSQLSNFKSKLKSLGKGSGDIDLPEFKPNKQKTKTFWKRLEYGTNLQTTKNSFFPVTTDLGVSVGYRINDKSVAGIGASYKIGWGNSIKHISITSQGIGLRSYVDVKLKGSFYASGGFEYNYQPIKPDSIFSGARMHWNDITSWKKSGLIGISKIISINNKFFKKTRAQLLWDFLSYQQTPRTQPLKFRMGYNF